MSKKRFCDKCHCETDGHFSCTAKEAFETEQPTPPNPELIKFDLCPACFTELKSNFDVPIKKPV